MTTNRPFFSNFLSAFRARSGIQKASTSPTGGVSGASLSSAYAQAAQAHAQHTSQFSTASTRHTTPSSTTAQTEAAKAITSTSTTSASQTQTQSRPIPTTTNGFTPRRQYHSTSPYSRSPGSPGPGLRPLTGAGSASSSSSAVHHNHHYQQHHSYAKERRGSDSSSEGFRETIGAEKWYIGGRTAAGEEKFYKLSMVRKPRSTDRLSFDRISM